MVSFNEFIPLLNELLGNRTCCQPAFLADFFDVFPPFRTFNKLKVYAFAQYLKKSYTLNVEKISRNGRRYV